MVYYYFHFDTIAAPAVFVPAAVPLLNKMLESKLVSSADPQHGLSRAGCLSNLGAECIDVGVIRLDQDDAEQSELRQFVLRDEREKLAQEIFHHSHFSHLLRLRLLHFESGRQ